MPTKFVSVELGSARICKERKIKKYPNLFLQLCDFTRRNAWAFLLVSIDVSRKNWEAFFFDGGSTLFLNVWMFLCFLNICWCGAQKYGIWKTAHSKPRLTYGVCWRCSYSCIRILECGWCHDDRSCTLWWYHHDRKYVQYTRYNLSQVASGRWAASLTVTSQE
jgi:hypothetical protein